DAADTTNSGAARLKNLSAKQILERIYVYGPPGYWGHYEANTSIAALGMVKLFEVDLKDPNLLLKQLFRNLSPTTGSVVMVAIIDPGIDAKHPDLQNVSGGLNCVTAEVIADPSAASDWGPAAVDGEHGTHVAGIVAGNGIAGGMRGVAPRATLRSYRVF